MALFVFRDGVKDYFVALRTNRRNKAYFGFLIRANHGSGRRSAWVNKNKLVRILY